MEKAYKTINAYYEKGKSIIEKAENEKQELHNEIENLRKDIAKLDMIQRQAIFDNNSELYAESVQENKAKQNNLDFSIKRLDKLKNRDLISKEDYINAVNDIIKAFEEEKAKALDEIILISERMYIIGDHLGELMQFTNSALHLYQNDLYNNKDRLKTKNGTCYHSGDEKTVTPSTLDLIDFAHTPASSYLYEKITGETKAKQNQRLLMG